jgi:hypothetical protein
MRCSLIPDHAEAAVRNRCSHSVPIPTGSPETVTSALTKLPCAFSIRRATGVSDWHGILLWTCACAAFMKSRSGRSLGSLNYC